MLGFALLFWVEGISGAEIKFHISFLIGSSAEDGEACLDDIELERWREIKDETARRY